MEIPLLLTKICLPPERPAGSQVLRQRLGAHLDQGLHQQCRLSLISAPAGFGKTTLVSAWARRIPAQVAWVSLDRDDNDAVRFLRYLVAACQVVQADAGVTALALLDIAQPPVAALTSLINDLAALPESLWIILDDYHLISLAAVHELTTYLLEHLPANVHLLLATRADPPLPLARLRARGELTEVRASDLRFSAEEAAAFLGQVMGLALSPQDIAALATRTEGWIAGLQLAALSLQNQASPSAFIQAFTGSHRYIADYLLEEVLQQQTPQTQTFLLQTSILEELTAPLCEALTGRPDSDAELERLARANLFLAAQDEERRWYRYHHLFADLLRLRLQQIFSPEAIAGLHRRACDWYLQQRLTPEAMRHALAAGQATRDYTAASALIERAAGRALRRGETATLIHWLEAIPEDERRARSGFAYFYAFALLLSGRLDAVEVWLQVAEQRQTSTATKQDTEARNAIAALRTLLAAYQGDVARTIALGQSALAQMTANDVMLYGVVAFGLADAYRWSGDFAAASRLYAQAVEHSQRGHNLNVVLQAYHHWAEVRLALGQLRQTQAHYALARRFAESVRLRSQAPVMGMLDLGEGWLAYERNELDVATYLWQAGQMHVQQMLQFAQRLEAHQLGLRLCLAHGMHAEADAQMEAIRQLVQAGTVPYLYVLAADSQIRFWAARADQRALDEWIIALEGEHGQSAWPLYIQFLADRALARAWLALGQPERALPLLEALRRQAETAAWYGEVIVIALLQARTDVALGDVAAAHLALLRALALAQPEGYLRTFLDEGPVIDHLLAESRPLDKAPGLAAYIGTLRYAFRASMPLAAKPAAYVPAGAQALVEPLSEREQDVLRLIAAGCTNAEIADKLVVALSTVKTHINHLYAKLSACSREEAIEHARQAGLF